VRFDQLKPQLRSPLLEQLYLLLAVSLLVSTSGPCRRTRGPTSAGGWHERWLNGRNPDSCALQAESHFRHRDPPSLRVRAPRSLPRPASARDRVAA
jgi:hypothetical protein